MPTGIPKNGINKGWFQKGHKRNVGIPRSDKTKRKQSKANKGKPSGMLGKHLTKATRQKISESNKGQTAWNKDKKCPKTTGKNNGNWKGGISFELYPTDWTEDLKKSIRKRDNYICQLCGIHQDELNGFFKNFDVHHIDYDKKNLDPKNLVSLCRKCHMNTNFNREYWIKYFQENYGNTNS